MNMKRVLSAVAISGAVVLGSTSLSSAAGNFYVGAFGIGSFYQDIEGKIGGSVTTERTVEFDPGYGGMLEAGYKMGNITFSLTGGYRKAKVDSITSATNIDADAHLYTAFLNVGYNFDQFAEKVTPFVNVGGGLMVADASVVFTDTADSNNTVGEAHTVYAPGIRLGIGMDYAIGTNVALSASYEAMMSLDGKFDNKFGSASDDLLVHSVLVGLKYGF